MESVQIDPITGIQYKVKQVGPPSVLQRESEIITDLEKTNRMNPVIYEVTGNPDGVPGDGFVEQVAASTARTAERQPRMVLNDPEE